MANGIPPLGHMISVIHHDQIPIRFLITDCPTEHTLSHYLKAFRQFNVSMVVKCCQSTYNSDVLLDQGIDFMDMPFRDGGVPNRTKLIEWKTFVGEYKTQLTPPTIAVHCVAGLGRAPVLVALALIELGLTSREAVGLIRQKRRGAFNRGQLRFLDRYKSSGSSSSKKEKQRRHHTTRSTSSMMSWGGQLLLKLTQRMAPHRQHNI